MAFYCSFSNYSTIEMKIRLLLILLILSNTAFAQLILADKKLVCPNEEVNLRINKDALKNTNFCVSYLNERFGYYYFKTCNQVTIHEAITMAKIMGGNLATANDDAKNRFLFFLLPNDIHWIGYYQDTTAKYYKDPPDPASGFAWMSKEPTSTPFWESDEPNNREDVNPGKYVVQGCRRTPSWCDVEDGLKFVGLIESRRKTIPVTNTPQYLWETGETTESIKVKPPKSKYYKVKIAFDTHEIIDSILIETPKISVDLSNPGGCNPYKWKPTLIANVPLANLDIEWKLGNEIKTNTFSPDFLLTSSDDIAGSIRINSLTCGYTIFSKDTLFKVFPMVKVPLYTKEVYLNDTINIVPQNKGPYSYQWSPPYGLSSDKEFSPFFIALKDEKFSVLISDDFGCTEREEFHYTINPNIKIFVPGAFSPNGDGLNDVFHLFLVDGFYGLIKQLAIFNREGKLLFKTNQLPFEWTGENCTMGEYIYQIDYEILQKMYSKRGLITLLR